ncbi:MAG: DMT family transporter [Clostridia bacterium]|nr:DMT family transporter [Clostridia bacterium]
MRKGRIYLELSAVIYGIIPTLSAFAYRGGANGITLLLLRNALALPVLYAIILADGRKLRVTGNRLCRLIILGVFGGAMPVLLLYMSYQYIAVSLAAALRFVSPVIVVIMSSVLYYRRPERDIVSAAVVVSAGVYICAGARAGVSGMGVLLALLSGAFHAFFIFYTEFSGSDREDIAVVSFYVALITSIFTFIFGAAEGSLYFHMTPLSRSLAFIISLASTICAMPLLQLGVRYSGAEEAGIFSAIELTTSMVLEWLVLGEMMSATQTIGSALIVFGVLIVRKKSTLNK